MEVTSDESRKSRGSLAPFLRVVMCVMSNNAAEDFDARNLIRGCSLATKLMRQVVKMVFTATRHRRRRC